MLRFRHLRWRRAGAATAVALVVIVGCPAAWAHVLVHPGTLPAATSDVELMFSVPNERDDARTVKVQIYFPSDTPLISVAVEPVPGWSSTIDNRTLSTPVQTDDGAVTQVVSDVTWTATAGGIAAGQFQNFTVTVGSLPPKPGTLYFKALQTYSSGEVVRWIDIPVSGQPTPDTPAASLVLTAAESGAGGSPGTASPAQKGGGSGTAFPLAIAALILAAAGLGTAVASTVRARRTE